MKYPCNLIRDLMPLYHDEVASEESILAIREHLDECRECRKYYDNMCESDAVEPISYDEEIEKRAAASYKAVYKKVLQDGWLYLFNDCGIVISALHCCDSIS